MTTNFRDSLPAELVTHIRSICGQRGEEWFEQLPRTIKMLEDKWSLKVELPFPGIEFNFVAPAIREGSEEVVLKVSPPLEQIEIYGEAAYLRYRAGEGAVKLLEEDRENQAILIERVLPGESLSEYFKGREPEVVQPMIDVLQAILRPMPAELIEAASLDKWFDGLRRSASTAFPKDYVVKALSIYEKLSQQSDRIFYLHADFHPGNVVTASRSPYLAIDPKGLIGHLGYDIAVFLNNFHWWQETRPDVRERLANAIDRFAVAFDISPSELRQWAFAQMVLGAWWTFDEMPEMYNNEVVKADVWNV